MVTKQSTITLDEAWDKRQALLKEGSEIFAEAEGLSKGRFTPAPNAKVGLWYASILAYYDFMACLEKARLKNFEADTVWHEAIMVNKGNIRIEWKAAGKAWACVLETGEVFEP